jgi:hypothetical protein
VKTGEVYEPLVGTAGHGAAGGEDCAGPRAHGWDWWGPAVPGCPGTQVSDEVQQMWGAGEQITGGAA